MTKPLKTQNEWIILTLIGAVAGFHVVSLDLKEKYKKPKPWINQASTEIHTATLGMKLTSLVCKLEIKINLSKSKVKLHPYSNSISTTKFVITPLFKINMHHHVKTSQHSKWMDNLKVDWSSGWILSCFLACEGKIHKPKPWINQACNEIHTATLGMKRTSMVCKLEIRINLSKSKVNLHPYSKSISTTECVNSPFFKINIHHQV